MKSFIAIASAVAFATSAVAQTVTSAPFELVIHSHNKYNGNILSPCHEGAAIEGLCPVAGNTSSTYNTYQFNTTQGETDSSAGKIGVLYWNLPVGTTNGTELVPSPFQLAYSPTSNVAVGLFEPNYDSTYVAFDSEGKLNIQTSLDDTVSPPKYTSPPKAFYNWYICETEYGYLYETLSWVVGNGKPQNPSCVKVEVVQKFV